MSLRSRILAGLACICICLFGYLTVCRLHAGPLVNSQLPPAMYGGLLFVLLAVNPLLKALRVRPLSSRELVGITGAALVCGALCGWGLAECLPTSAVLPHHYARVKPGWKDAQVLQYAPRFMLVDPSADESRTVDGYITGLGEPGQSLPLSRVPWGAWVRPLLFWLPLMACATLATFGLAAVFHTQWSEHEQLPYPIAAFVSALLPERDGETRGRMFRDGLFWAGFGCAFLIMLNNGLLVPLFPRVFIPVRLRFDFMPFAKCFPTLLLSTKGAHLFRPYILFPLVGFAYFLATDVSFTLAFTPIVYCWIAGILAGYGIQMRAGRLMALSPELFVFAGGYFGILVLVFYTGRRYYWMALRRGLGLAAADQVQDHAVWGMRVFLGATVGFLALLMCTGLDWYLALLYTFFMLMVFTVVSRMIAETGAYKIDTFIFPGVLAWAGFGAAALGPRTLLIMFLVSSVVVSTPGWCAMPFLGQVLRLNERIGETPRSMCRWAVAALVLALLVGVPAIIYWQYVGGLPRGGWPRMVARYPFATVLEIVHQLKGQGLLEQSQQLHGLQRLAHLSPRWPYLGAFALCAALAVGCGLGRHKFARWPVHPVAFVFLGSTASAVFWFSFFLGGLVKTVLTHYGGGRAYERAKPLMIGLVAGHLLAEFVRFAVAAIRAL